MGEILSLDQHAFMVTYTGLRFNLTDPRVEDIRLEDIAHSLSQLCRFTGHTKRFYSVATHCILASRCIDPEYALEALLHDAAEAYVNDLSRPLKRHPDNKGYLLIERKINKAVRQRFGLPYFADEPHMSAEVKWIDNALVVTEARVLMAEHTWADGHKGLYVEIPDWAPGVAEEQYLHQFFALTT